MSEKRISCEEIDRIVREQFDSHVIELGFASAIGLAMNSIEEWDGKDVPRVKAFREAAEKYFDAMRNNAESLGRRIAAEIYKEIG